MNREDALKALNIKKSNPSVDEIKAAHRDISKKYHPDAHQDVSEDILEAVRDKFERAQAARKYLLSLFGETQSHSEQAKQDSSQTYADTGLPPQGLWQNFPHVIKEVEQCRKYIERRQFDIALIHAENAQSEIPDDYDLLLLKFEVLGNLERHHRVETELVEWEKKFPKLRYDFNHRLTYFVALRSQGKNNIALNVISDLIDREGEVPTLLGMKASTLIEMGQGRKADLIIDRLKVIDPTHPLVQSRSNVVLVGDTYVDKGGAAQDACFICIILECLFDCL